MARHRLMAGIVVGSLALSGIAYQAASQTASETPTGPPPPQAAQAPGTGFWPMCPWGLGFGGGRGPMRGGGPAAPGMQSGPQAHGPGAPWGFGQAEVGPGFQGPGFQPGMGRGAGRGFGRGMRGAGPGMAGRMGPGFSGRGLGLGSETVKQSTEKTATGAVTTITTEEKQLVAVIQAHARVREARIADARPRRLWDPLFADLYLHQDEIARRVDLTENGVRIVEEGSTPEAVKLIHAHADLRAAVEEYGRAALAKPHDSPLRTK